MDRELLDALLANIPNAAVFLVDRDLRYVAANGPILGAILRRVGVADVVGKTVGEVSEPEHRIANEQLYERTLAGETVRMASRRGDTTYELTAVPILSGGVVTHALLFAYDVSQRERDRALLDATLAHIEDGVALLDENRRALLANRAYLAMFDLTFARLATMTRADFIDHAAAMAADPDDFRERFERQVGEPMDFELARPQRRILRRTWTAVEGSGGRYLVTWHDVTAAVDLLSERERLTMLDPLTGIANRRFADRTLAREIDHMTRAGSELSIALLDIDYFKRVNDTYGHNVGDAVLRRVARILTDVARDTDVVARWGGEEFIAVLTVGLGGARVFGERARAAIEADAAPDLPPITISVGVTEVGAGEAPVAAVARADARLYEAKQRGRNRVEG